MRLCGWEAEMLSSGGIPGNPDIPLNGEKISETRAPII
jgi:hypothetical protein